MSENQHPKASAAARSGRTGQGASSHNRGGRSASGAKGIRAKAMQTAKRNRKKQLLKRRITFTAIVVVLLLLVVLLITTVVRNLGGKVVTENTLTVVEDGVIYEEVSNEDGLSKSEVKDFAKDAISDFNKEQGKRLAKLEKISEKDGKIYLKTSYDSVEAYSTFSGYEAFCGTIAEAKAAGYDFNTSFVSVADGVKGDTATVDEVTTDENKKVLIVRENVVLAVDGTISYVTDASSEVVDESSIRITASDANEDASVLTYIVYE